MEQPKLSENLKKRLISAAVLIPVILAVIAIGGTLFTSVVVLVTILMSFEWNAIIEGKEKEGEELLDHKKWLLLGIAYIGIPVVSLLLLRSFAEGAIIVFWLCAVIWATDSAAYFVGKKIGGPKMSPTISPNKTWSGLAGGVAAAFLVGGFFATFWGPDHWFFIFMLSGIFAVVAQISDLLESAIKRHFSIKDSGTIIPGHGGVLDRLDSFTLTVPLILLIALVNGGRIFTW